MRLLERIQDVLALDDAIVAMLQGANRVGTNMRLLPHPRCIELGIISDAEQDLKRQKSVARVSVTVYCDNGSVVHEIASRAIDLLTPQALTLRTPEHARLIVGSVRKTAHSTLPVDDHGHQIELTFTIRYLNY